MLGPGEAEKTTDSDTELSPVNADAPGHASSAQTRLPLAHEPLHATQPSEVAATETPTQSNASCLLHAPTNCLIGAFPLGEADEIQFSAAEFTSRSLQILPS
jgi:hypothetical protein